MDIKLPKLGEGADSGTVVAILVKVGDAVQAGQTLLELENEKAIAPIPSPVAGTVDQIFVQEGQKLSVGQRIASVVESSGRGVSQASPVAAAARPSGAAKAPAKMPVREPIPVPVLEKVSEAVSAGQTEPVASRSQETSGQALSGFAEPVPGGEPPAAAPSLRKLARELGIDLSRVRGSERGGRIVAQDLRDYIQRLQEIVFAPPAKPANAEPIKTATTPAVAIDFSQWGPVSKKPMSPLRSVISRRMFESWSTIPQVNQFDEADITDLMELRKKYASAFEAKSARLTLTPFTLKAVVAALKQSPIFNASLDEAAQEIVYKEYYHLGLAVDTDAGLLVPVIRDVDRKNLLELAKELQSLAERARTRKVSSEEMKGGTFTISNQGGIGGAHFTPIINKPEVAILGLGRSVIKPVWRNGQIVPREMMPLCVSYDHRVIDGGSAARFIVQLVQALEHYREEELASVLK